TEQAGEEKVKSPILPYAGPDARPKSNIWIQFIPLALCFLGILIQMIFANSLPASFMVWWMCVGFGLAVLVLLRTRARSIPAWFALVFNFIFAALGTTTNF